MIGINSNRENLIGKELPYAHYLHPISAIVFLLIWFLDSFVIKFSIGLAKFIPWVFRLIFSLVVITLAIVIMYFAEKDLFHEKHEVPTVIDTGLLACVRHPLYLGVLLLYFGFILGTFSIISLLIFLIVIIFYNKMATYEEQDLERIFEEEYLDYKRRVPKWIPRISAIKPTNSDDRPIKKI